MKITIPGIYPNLSNEDYHKSEGLSNSKMSLLLPPSCPANFRYHEDHVEHKDTDAFSLGTAVHTMCFEPLEFSKRFFIVQEVPKRNSNLGKAAHEGMLKQAGNKIILDKEDHAIVQAMSRAVTGHQVWKNLMAKVNKDNSPTYIEHSLAWYDDEYNVLLRSRPDFYTHDLIIDLKTTKDSTLQAFSRSVAEYAYHRQAALACAGLKVLTGRDYTNVILFVIDKNPPHFARCYVLNQSALMQGVVEYKKAAQIYAECIQTHEWPRYPEIVEDLDIPNYAYRTFDDE